MSTSTNPRPDNDSQSAIDRVLELLSATTDDRSILEPLSDLSRTAATYLAERWLALPRDVRLHAVQMMRDDAEENVERNYSRVMLIAMRDEDPEVRLAAIDGLAELETPAFCETLLSVIENEDDDRVRAAHAMALGRYAMQAELNELDEQVAARVRDVLLTLVESDPSREVRRRALESAGYFSGDDDVISEIEMAYDSGDHALRVSAIHAMGRQADPRWLEIVHEEMTSDDPELRFEAVMAVGTIGEERSVVELIERLSDEDTEVQLAAIASLGAIGGKLAINVLQRLLDEDSPAIVDAAEDALEEAQIGANPLRPLM